MTRRDQRPPGVAGGDSEGPEVARRDRRRPKCATGGREGLEVAGGSPEGPNEWPKEWRGDWREDWPEVALELFYLPSGYDWKRGNMSNLLIIVR